MSTKPNRSTGAPVAQPVQPDTQPQGNAGGSPSPNVAQSSATDILSAQIAEMQASQRRLENELAKARQEQQRQAPPDRWTDAQYRDVYAIPEDMLEQGTSYFDGARHITRHEIQQAATALAQQTKEQTFDAVVNSHYPGYQSLYKSASYQEFARLFPHRNNVLIAAYESFDTGPMIQVFREHEAWARQQAAQAQQQAQQMQQVQQPPEPMQYAPQPDPYAYEQIPGNRHPHPYGDAPVWPQQRPQPQWDIPAFNEVDRSEEQTVRRQQAQQQYQQQVQTMPRNAAAPPPSNGQPQYDINAVLAEKSELAAKYTSIQNTPPQVSQRRTYLDMCLNDYQARLTSGQVR